MTTSYIIIYISSNIFNCVILDRFMKVFFENPISNRYVLLATYALYPVLTSIFYFLFNIPLLNVAINIICLFLLTFCYSSNLLKNFIAVMIIFSLFIALDAFSAGIVGYFNVSLFERGTYDSEIGLIIQKLILFLLALVLKNFRNIKNKLPVSKVFWLTTIALPIASIYLILIILSSNINNQIVITISTIVIFGINILTFVIYDEISAFYNMKIEHVALEQEKKYYYNQCELMNSATKDLRSFRHDISNHLLSLLGYVKSKEYREAEKYIGKLTGEVETNDVYCDTGNVAFDSLINYKLRNANRDNINIDIKVNIPDELSLSVTDIVIILGNLLDNSLEAIEKASDKILKVEITNSKGRLFIHTENSYDGTYKIHEDKLISLKKNKEIHGIGIPNIERIIEKYDGVLTIKPRTDLFIIDILLFT